jgi:hypothetical protein
LEEFVFVIDLKKFESRSGSESNFFRFSIIDILCRRSKKRTRPGEEKRREEEEKQGGAREGQESTNGTEASRGINSLFCLLMSSPFLFGCPTDLYGGRE